MCYWRHIMIGIFLYRCPVVQHLKLGAVDLAPPVVFPAFLFLYRLLPEIIFLALDTRLYNQLHLYQLADSQFFGCYMKIIHRTLRLLM